jgi:hypothetical protein
MSPNPLNDLAAAAKYLPAPARSLRVSRPRIVTPWQCTVDNLSNHSRTVPEQYLPCMMPAMMLEKRNIVTTLRELATNLLALKAHDVTQIHRLGTENAFDELEEMLSSLQAVLRKVEACNFDDVPEKTIVHLNELLKGMQRSVEQVKSYQASQGAQPKADLLNQFRHHVIDTFDAAVPIFAVNAVRPFEDYKQALQQFSNQANATLAGIRNNSQEATAAVAAAKDAAQSAKEAAAKTGITEQAAHFQEEANYYQAAGRWWLVLTAVGIGIVVALAIWTFFHPYEITPATRWIVIQKSVAKFVLLSIASFFLIFAVRNYNTSRHNQVVNQHRAKALASFQAFASDAKDDETRKAVLMYAARAAFSHQTSGYLKKEGDYAGPSVVDLAKLFVGK